MHVVYTGLRCFTLSCCLFTLCVCGRWLAVWCNGVRLLVVCSFCFDFGLLYDVPFAGVKLVERVGVSLSLLCMFVYIMLW